MRYPSLKAMAAGKIKATAKHFDAVKLPKLDQKAARAILAALAVMAQPFSAADIQKLVADARKVLGD